MIPVWFISSALVAIPITDDSIRTSIDRGIHRLETATASYVKNRNCFSCHHQAVPLLALAAAKDHGFKVDPKVLDQQLQFTLDSFKNKTKEISNGKGIGGANTTVAYALLTLNVAGHTRDSTTDALVEFLIKKQHKDGSWPATTDRPPSEGSAFTSGALALQGLKHFAPASDEDDSDLSERISTTSAKGLAYLRNAKPNTTEDHVFLLWALIAGGAGEADIAKARDELVKRQNPNGGWPQLDDGKSDAYATGSALVALNRGGLSPKDESYRRAVRFLVLTQHESGGWIVPTRSRPIQTFFDNGDPGGKSQFISTAATGWAVAALVEAIEKK